MEYHIECPNKDYDLILKEYKEIPLTQGKITIVDAEDYEWLNQWKWYAYRHRNTYYAMRNDCKSKKMMHREIMKPPEDKEPDHINNNGLDNRRENLRICSRSQNQANRNKQYNNTSGYKGVSWHKWKRKWQALIGINNKWKHLGYYLTKQQAALAYNNAALEYFGEFARLNNL